MGRRPSAALQGPPNLRLAASCKVRKLKCPHTPEVSSWCSTGPSPGSSPRDKEGASAPSGQSFPQWEPPEAKRHCGLPALEVTHIKPICASRHLPQGCPDLPADKACTPPACQEASVPLAGGRYSQARRAGLLEQSSGEAVSLLWLKLKCPTPLSRAAPGAEFQAVAGPAGLPSSWAGATGTAPRNLGRPCSHPGSRCPCSPHPSFCPHVVTWDAWGPELGRGSHPPGAGTPHPL